MIFVVTVDLNALFHEPKDLICFGISKHVEEFCDSFGSDDWLDSVKCFVDNDPGKYNGSVEYRGRTFPVYDPSCLEGCRNTNVLITVKKLGTANEIAGQLSRMKIDDSNKCFNLRRIEEYNKYQHNDNAVEQHFSEGQNTPQINKTIHSCWLSGEEKPDMYLKCMESWRKYCPDYEIIEWTPENYDLSKNKYLLQAYESGKWAFASDYIRLDAIHEYGGLYMDMDVEIKKCLDPLLGFSAFFSIDQTAHIDLGSGFGARKEHPLIKRLLDAYSDLEFSAEEQWGDDRVLVTQPARLLPLFMQAGFRKTTDSQIVDSCAYLSPNFIRIIEDPVQVGRNIRGDEYAIHWHYAGWQTQEYIVNRQNKWIRYEEDLRKYDSLCL